MIASTVSYDTIESITFIRHRKLFVSVERLMSFDYVRESQLYIDNPSLRIGKRKRPLFGEQHGSLIAYAVIGRAMPYIFSCLIWWHKKHDRDVQPDGVYRLSEPFKNNPKYRHWGPCEAVPPGRVLEFFPEYQEGL